VGAGLGAHKARFFAPAIWHGGGTPHAYFSGRVMSVTVKKLLAVALGLVFGVGGPLLLRERPTRGPSIQRVIAEAPAYQIQPLVLLPPVWIVAGSEAERLLMTEADATAGVAVASADADGLGLREGRGRLGRLRPADVRGRIRPAATDRIDEPPVPQIARSTAPVPAAEGVLEASKLERTIKLHRAEIQACASDPDGARYGGKPKGKVALRWIVRPDGAARNVEIAESSVGDPRVSRCVAEAVGRWRFARPEGGAAAVTSTFVFL
jgi:TonB family protein